MKRTPKVQVGKIASALDRFEEVWNKAARTVRDTPTENSPTWSLLIAPAGPFTATQRPGRSRRSVPQRAFETPRNAPRNRSSDWPSADWPYGTIT
jgi:hypothetical protein